MNLWEILILFFAFQSMMIGIFFFFKERAEGYANKILACFLFCFGYILFHNVLFWSKLLFTETYAHLIQTYLIPQSLLAPLFFFYIRNIVNREKIDLRKDWGHFIPTAWILISFAPYFIQNTQTKLLISEQRNFSEYTFLLIPNGPILTLLMLGYMWYIFSNYFKQFDKDIDLKIWLQTISYSFFACVLAYFGYYFLAYTQILTLNQDYMITVFMAACIFIISFFSFNQPEIFNGKPIETIIPVFKYKKSSIANDQSMVMKKSLLKCMQAEKPYLKSDLRLDDLAQLLDLPRHHTSQIINEHFQLNFNDFINKYRVEAAINLLEQNGQLYNMKEIAYKVGFNNYVSFYKAFKKMTGSLPTDFKKRLSQA